MSHESSFSGRVNGYFRRLPAYFGQFHSDLWVLSLGWLVAALGFAASIPFIAIYFQKVMGMSTTEIGIFFAVMAIIRAFFQALGGELSDRVGRRTLLIHLPFYRVVTFVLLGLAIEFHWGFWAIAVILMGNFFTGAVFITSISAMVADLVPDDKRLDGYAISRSAGNAGWAVGPAIGGYLAASSYATLFYFSGVVTLFAGLIFWRYLETRQQTRAEERFRISDVLSIHRYPLLAWHGVLTLVLYLVVAQLVAPLSLYAVNMVGLTEIDLGHLLMLNGLMVLALQLPVTRLTSRFRLTGLMASGALLYFAGYSLMGTFIGFWPFFAIIFVVTIGELIMSPPTMTLTSRMAPEGRTGRFMGMYGFFVTLGWSMGPLYGGALLDIYGDNWALGWLAISSLAAVAATGYWILGRRLPQEFNRPQRLFNDN
jgi:predicted MFS family arabinose efflux permease